MYTCASNSQQFRSHRRLYVVRQSEAEFQQALVVLYVFRACLQLRACLNFYFLKTNNV
jgi:hypothetical protein